MITQADAATMCASPTSVTVKKTFPTATPLFPPHHAVVDASGARSIRISGAVRDPDEVAAPDHLRLLGPDPVRDEVRVVPGLPVVDAVVTEQIVGLQLSGEVKEITRHAG